MNGLRPALLPVASAPYFVLQVADSVSQAFLFAFVRPAIQRLHLEAAQPFHPPPSRSYRDQIVRQNVYHETFPGKTNQ